VIVPRVRMEERARDRIRIYGAYGGVGSLAQDIAKLKVVRTETAIR
jgi:hypothetical protein